MKPILEYLKRRKKQTYAIDYSFDGIVELLNNSGFSSVQRSGTLFDTFLGFGKKCYILVYYSNLSYVKTEIFAYNPQASHKMCTLLHIQYNKTGNMVYCSLGQFEYGKTNWLNTGETNLNNIDDFFADA